MPLSRWSATKHDLFSLWMMLHLYYSHEQQLHMNDFLVDRETAGD